jgi:hypothetical protein
MEPDNGPLVSQQFLERFERLQLESLRSRVTWLWRFSAKTRRAIGVGRRKSQT